MVADKLVVYSPSQVSEGLQDRLPRWYFEEGFIKREVKTSSWKSTLMVVNTIGHLAEAAWHHPDLYVSFNSVVVMLVTHSEKGITELDFELAEKIEEVVLWQPGVEQGAITGTPDTDRHRYIVYGD